MRSLYFILLTSLYFISCGGECACKMGAANVTTIQSVYDAFAEGNIDGVTASFASDIVWNEAENYPYADNNPYNGAEEIVQGVFARIGGEWEYFNTTGIDINPVGGTHVLATGRYQGKHKASGKSLDAQFAHLWGLNEGKISSFQQYTDTEQAIEVATVDVSEEEGE